MRNAIQGCGNRNSKACIGDQDKYRVETLKQRHLQIDKRSVIVGKYHLINITEKKTLCLCFHNLLLLSLNKLITLHRSVCK